MPDTGVKRQGSGWRAVCLIAITYVYFLIFAQFAFLKRLAVLGIVDDHLKAVMGTMAGGGILFSLLTPRLKLCPSPNLRLRIALAVSAIAAALILLPLGLAASIVVAFLIGCGLGLLTVTLVTCLRLWLGVSHHLLMVGLGTGIGYLICNFPALFTATPQIQALTVAVLCVAGIGITFTRVSPVPEEPAVSGQTTVPFVRSLACFTALVWLDSAAFFIIQNTPELKAGTWEGEVHLWVNGLLHLSAALAAVWLLRRRSLSFLLSLSFFGFACACLLLLDPGRALAASAFYPAGVSLYSVALVAYPSLLSPASSEEERGKRAGWIYAIAGWFGSAMGIGMGQNLGRVPPAFVVAAGAVILLPPLLALLRRRRREVFGVATVLLVAVGMDLVITSIHPVERQMSRAERGRQVYVAEGCISCHSQFVRPNTPDVAMWGPVTAVEKIRGGHPPLIGNRRQGPDLAEVGSRRSALWLKAHFYDPAEISHDSFMPSYGYLFRDQRGDELVTYLESLRSDGKEPVVTDALWRPSGIATAEATATQGEQLYLQRCATCHSGAGATRNRWRGSFKRQPPDLKAGPFLYLGGVEKNRVAQIVKFGIRGTDMAGHEYYPDRDISSISLWLAQNVARTRQDVPITGQEAK